MESVFTITLTDQDGNHVESWGIGKYKGFDSNARKVIASEIACAMSDTEEAKKGEK